MATRYKSKFQIKPEHVDDLVQAHIAYRNQLGPGGKPLTGVQPAEVGRREHERYHAKQDQIALAPPPEKEPVMKKGHCLNCGGEKEFESEEVHHHANKTIQHKGKCPTCGKGMVSHFESKGGADAK